ncbi:MAG TPA: toll/interleukin-1 receptor domain-containing protein [Verrucomicrobiales bacterium]|nr:toll/interleukin-1 receptor domain-containing protein [Verrucomicrobiales bacterium]
MSAPVPPPALRLILLRGPGDGPEAGSVAETIRRAFSGGIDPGGSYLAGGEELNVDLRDYAGLPNGGAEALDLIRDSLHSLVAVLVRRPARDEQLAWDAWVLELDAIAREAAQSGERHGFLMIDLDGSGRDVIRAAPETGRFQLLELRDLGEEAVRPAHAAVRVLHHARLLLAGGLGLAAGDKLRFFISHAKMDGLPLALALKALLKDPLKLDAWYDADDIVPGSDWQKALRQGVLSSVLIVLRTENYDLRPWCRQEVLWAEDFAAPMIVVEARTRLLHAPSPLPLSAAPWVRVGDGNLVRVVYAALRESLRLLLFRRRVKALEDDRLIPAGCVVLPRTPGLRTMLQAGRDLLARTPPGADKMILYPEPPLAEAERFAAESILASIDPSIRLLTETDAAADV